MRIAVSPDGKTLAESKIIPTPESFAEGIKILKQTADELSHNEKITTVAGGIAGPLDKEKTMLSAGPHISGWIQKPLKVELEEKFSAPVYLENDTALIGLGEAVKGAGVGQNIVAYLGIGTGVGGARIVDQKIDENSLGFEPGHQIIVPDGNQCRCGGKGHLETYVGGAYLAEIYHKQVEEIKDPNIWESMAKYLSIGLNNTIVHWSPDIVVLGGSVMKGLPIESVTTHLKDSLTIFRNPPPITTAALGHDGGLYGALELLK